MTAMQAVANELKAALDKLYTDLARKHGMPWPMGTSGDHAFGTQR
jgi:hypothetical protein